MYQRRQFLHRAKSSHNEKYSREAPEQFGTLTEKNGLALELVSRPLVPDKKNHVGGLQYRFPHPSVMISPLFLVSPSFPRARARGGNSGGRRIFVQRRRGLPKYPNLRLERNILYTGRRHAVQRRPTIPEAISTLLFKRGERKNTSAGGACFGVNSTRMQ